MKSVDRQFFIQNIWNRYPNLPDQSRYFGALKQVTVSDKKILLKIDDQYFEVDRAIQKSETYKYLATNDIVTIDREEQIVLLAPCLVELELNVDFDKQQKWNSYLQQVKEFFIKNNFIELQTPNLVVCPGTEPTIEVFQTEFQLGSYRKKLFLATSPELSIKKVIAQGVRKKSNLSVFEIAKVFRNDELTERHLPEFFMLEWYRTFHKLNSIQEDIVSLVQNVSGQSHVTVVRRSMRDLYKEYVDFDLRPQTTYEELAELATRLNIDHRQMKNFDDLFNLIFIEKIEFQWPKNVLFFLEKYPPSQAALARLDAEGWAERFEFYWQGLEIANAFYELNDPVIQRERMKKDIEQKKINGKKEIPMDEEFLKSLEFGFPPTSGVALGLERLFMAINGISNINKLTEQTLGRGNVQ